jgi:hypothetical protein
VAVQDAPEVLTLQKLCSSGCSEWESCTVRLGSSSIHNPPASGVLRSLGLKRNRVQLPCPGKLVKRKRCFAHRMCIWSLTEVPVRSPQLHLSGKGLTLQHGTIELSSGCTWCIDTSRTVFQGTTIRGVFFQLVAMCSWTVAVANEMWQSVYLYLSVGGKGPPGSSTHLNMRLNVPVDGQQFYFIATV